jgi:hypothetical protein
MLVDMTLTSCAERGALLLELPAPAPDVAAWPKVPVLPALAPGVAAWPRLLEMPAPAPDVAAWPKVPVLPALAPGVAACPKLLEMPAPAPDVAAWPLLPVLPALAAVVAAWPKLLEVPAPAVAFLLEITPTGNPSLLIAYLKLLLFCDNNERRGVNNRLSVERKLKDRWPVVVDGSNDSQTFLLVEWVRCSVNSRQITLHGFNLSSLLLY